MELKRGEATTVKITYECHPPRASISLIRLFALNSTDMTRFPALRPHLLHPLPSIRYPLLTLLLAALAGCDPEKPTSNLATIQLPMGQKTFTLEVADNDRDRKYGLMRRDSMPADHGMIFVFDREDRLAFYMRNTHIPLDIVYLDSKGTIVSIKQMKPFDENTTPSDGPAQYAIELNKDIAAAAGLKPGMTIKLPELKAKD